MGWFYFGGNQTQDLSGYQFNDVQKSILDDTGAMVIRGVIGSVQNQYNPWDQFGNWQSGSLLLTVRHENKLAYWDRIVVLDSEMVYSEIIDYESGDLIPTRYKVTGVNVLRGADTVYTPDDDYEINSVGQLVWRSGKSPESKRVAVHYTCYPTFLIVEHPHLVRTTSLKYKTAVNKTPGGDTVGLPVQALVRYDFLPTKSQGEE
jgi:hypothetical protein